MATNAPQAPGSILQLPKQGDQVGIGTQLLQGIAANAGRGAGGGGGPMQAAPVPNYLGGFADNMAQAVSQQRAEKFRSGESEKERKQQTTERESSEKFRAGQEALERDARKKAEDRQVALAARGAAFKSRNETAATQLNVVSEFIKANPEALRNPETYKNLKGMLDSSLTTLTTPLTEGSLLNEAGRTILNGVSPGLGDARISDSNGPHAFEALTAGIMGANRDAGYRKSIEENKLKIMATAQIKMRSMLDANEAILKVLQFEGEVKESKDGSAPITGVREGFPRPQQRMLSRIKQLAESKDKLPPDLTTDLLRAALSGFERPAMMLPILLGPDADTVPMPPADAAATQKYYFAMSGALLNQADLIDSMKDITPARKQELKEAVLHASVELQQAGYGLSSASNSFEDMKSLTRHIEAKLLKTAAGTPEEGYGTSRGILEEVTNLPVIDVLNALTNYGMYLETLAPGVPERAMQSRRQAPGATPASAAVAPPAQPGMLDTAGVVGRGVLDEVGGPLLDYLGGSLLGGAGRALSATDLGAYPPPSFPDRDER